MGNIYSSGLRSRRKRQGRQPARVTGQDSPRGVRSLILFVVVVKNQIVKVFWRTQCWCTHLDATIYESPELLDYTLTSGTSVNELAVGDGAEVKMRDREPWMRMWSRVTTPALYVGVASMSMFWNPILFGLARRDASAEDAKNSGTRPSMPLIASYVFRRSVSIELCDIRVRSPAKASSSRRRHLALKDGASEASRELVVERLPSPLRCTCSTSVDELLDSLRPRDALLGDVERKKRHFPIPGSARPDTIGSAQKMALSRFTARDKLRPAPTAFYASQTCTVSNGGAPIARYNLSVARILNKGLAKARRPRWGESARLVVDLRPGTPGEGRREAMKRWKKKVDEAEEGVRRSLVERADSLLSRVTGASRGKKMARPSLPRAPSLARGATRSESST